MCIKPCVLLLSVLCFALILCPAGAQQAGEGKSAPARRYIRPDAPQVRIPPYQGDSYTARVPDTLAIDPPGRNYPYYQREHYRSDQPRWRKARRFVSSERIDW